MVLAGRYALIRSRRIRLEVLEACIRIAYRIFGNWNCSVNIVVILR
jgi:hypothetical protein